MRPNLYARGDHVRPRIAPAAVSEPRIPWILSIGSINHADLRAHYGTGQAILLSGSGRDKKYGYRNGIQTDIGDIRVDVWCQLVHELVIRSGEETLYAHLAAWEKERNYCSRTRSELEEHTLQLYAMRIFDMPDWVDYAAFSKHSGYHPVLPTK